MTALAEINAPLKLLLWGVGVVLLAAVVLWIGEWIQRSLVRWRYQGSRRHSRRVARGKGLPLAELARRLDMPADDLAHFTPRYTERHIPKKSGKPRRLMVPDDATKKLQRRILRRLLAKLRAHPAACGFERGKSIVDNAAPHAGKAVVIKMDVVDFFPSTRAERIDRYFRWIGWDTQCAAILTRLTTHDGGLPQGAPTSPRLSNLVNYYLDVQLSNFAKKRKGTYTRYADDITFSFPKDYPRRIRGTILKARRTLQSKGYKAHTGRKLRTLRRHQRQTVTGLVVNAQPQLPRHTRRWLRAVRHRLTTGKAATLTPAQLKGWEAFEKMIASRSAGANS